MMLRSPLLFLMLLWPLIAVSSETGLLIDDFEQGLGPEWRVKEFKGRTSYLIVADGTSQVLQADSAGTASGLMHRKEFLIADYPVISWRWKVDGVIEKGDALHKQGDDYAARVYIIFPHWFYPNTKSLNYIWANTLQKGSVVPNPYTDSAMMIAVESGPENAGSWQTVRRNIADDYRRAFGKEPPKKGVVAIMTDTDNTGGRARAWYDDIRIEPARQP